MKSFAQTNTIATSPTNSVQVGQYTRFVGVEREPQAGVHFCGEHTLIDAQGYLEGAVETGQRAANEIISALR